MVRRFRLAAAAAAVMVPALLGLTACGHHSHTYVVHHHVVHHHVVHHHVVHHHVIHHHH